MTEQQSKDIDRIQALVRSAGQNVLDALEEIKAIKEGQPMKTKHYPEPNGRVTTVIEHEHGMIVHGNYDPKTRPQWKSRETAKGTEYYTDGPELPGKGSHGKHGLKPSRPNGRTDRPRRHQPYKRDRSGGRGRDY